jgi:hypothetical protein
MDRSCEATGHGRTRSTPRPGLRPERHPGAASRLRPLRARRSVRSGCRYDAAAWSPRSSGIRRGPHAAAPDGCGACQHVTARFFSLEQPWDSAPSLTTYAPRTTRGMTKIHDWTKTRAAPSSRATHPSQWLMISRLRPRIICSLADGPEQRSRRCFLMLFARLDVTPGATTP